jgi:hypothetical protein
MRNFIFIIASTDDIEFETPMDLREAYYNGFDFSKINASIFKFKLNENCGTDLLSLNDIATLVGRGMAFESDWCMDDTLSILIEEAA